MVKNILCFVLAAIVCTGCVNIQAKKCCPEEKAKCQKECPKMLRHVVLFKFKEGTGPEKISEVEKAFAALPEKIKEIQKFEWGTNVSVENRSEGFTHCFVVSFLNEDGRNIYLNHPDHKAFGKVLGGSLDKVLVVDYWNVH
jgi:hypothetical protein